MNLLCLEFEFVIRLFLIDVSVFLNFELSCQHWMLF